MPMPGAGELSQEPLPVPTPVPTSPLSAPTQIPTPTSPASPIEFSLDPEGEAEIPSDDAVMT
eukprot:4966501-Pyramimonas_sp.AAC.1